MFDILIDEKRIRDILWNIALNEYDAYTIQYEIRIFRRQDFGYISLCCISYSYCVGYLLIIEISSFLILAAPWAAPISRVVLQFTIRIFV